VLLVVTVLFSAAVASASATNPQRQNGQNDFDYQFGVWNVRVSTLARSSTRWLTYIGTHTVTPLWNGRANIGVMEIRGPAGKIEGLQLRLYNPVTRQWKLSFASSADGELQRPMAGRFHGANAEFFGTDVVAGKAVLVRSQSIGITPLKYRDVIAYSADRGRTWKPTWIADYEKQAR
jgi:hypothetical protein